MDWTAYAVLLIAIAIGVVGQLLFKYGMLRRPGFRLRNVWSLAGDGPVIAGFCCYGIATLLYFRMVASLDLSLAYPTVSLGYVLVIVMSRLLFNESVSRAQWMAVLTICGGRCLGGPRLGLIPLLVQSLHGEVKKMLTPPRVAHRSSEHKMLSFLEKGKQESAHHGPTCIGINLATGDTFPLPPRGM